MRYPPVRLANVYLPLQLRWWQPRITNLEHLYSKGSRRTRSEEKLQAQSPREQEPWSRRAVALACDSTEVVLRQAVKPARKAERWVETWLHCTWTRRLVSAAGTWCNWWTNCFSTVFHCVYGNTSKNKKVTLYMQSARQRQRHRTSWKNSQTGRSRNFWIPKQEFATTVRLCLGYVERLILETTN